jgi:hypothetical protein
MMPSPEALQDVRAALQGADRQFQVIDGGKRGGGGGGPPENDTEDQPCPVSALGHLDGTYYFLDRVGQMRSLSSRQIGNRHELLGLFGGDDGWLRSRFPKKAQCKIKGADGEDTTEERVVDFRINSVAAHLQAECTEQGLFGDHILIRRPGIWSESGGMPVVHCGDQVLMGDRMEAAGARTGNQIWAAAPPAPRPGVPCEADAGRYLQQQIQGHWNFRFGGGAIAAIGLLGCAYYGAAIPWRPAGFLIGGAGSGKSSLLTVLRSASPMNFYTNDTSKAGLEQSLDGRAMPSYIDEASDREDQRGARALLDLVLSASGGEGTKGSRGGTDGKARKIEVAGSIIMASISPPDMKAQHLGRFTIIDLDRPDVGADFSAEHRDLGAWAKKNGAGLWGRALAGWSRYRDALASFRGALSKAGCAPREMDQLGALLAGWFILTADGLPNDQQALDGVEAIRDFIRDREDVVAQDAPMQMINRLLSVTVQMQRSTERKPIGELIGRVLRPANTEGGPDEFGMGTAIEILAQYGMRVIRHDEPKNRQGKDAPRLALGNGIWFSLNNSMLRDLFGGTPFEGNRWSYELMRLESARRASFTLRIGRMPPSKCVWVTADELGFGGPGDD